MRALEDAREQKEIDPASLVSFQAQIFALQKECEDACAEREACFSWVRVAQLTH